MDSPQMQEEAIVRRRRLQLLTRSLVARSLQLLTSQPRNQAMPPPDTVRVIQTRLRLARRIAQHLATHPAVLPTAHELAPAPSHDSPAPADAPAPGDAPEPDAPEAPSHDSPAPADAPEPDAPEAIDVERVDPST